MHHEIEVVVKICKNGKHIDTQFASGYYQEISLGIDFTSRDIQKHCKENGLPWEKAKAFDNSAVLSNQWIDKASIQVNNLEFSLTKNDQIVQKGNTKDMIFSIDQLIAHVSKYITLKQGDLIYTGTPEGVGAVALGDKLSGFIGDSKLFDLVIR